MLGGRKLGSKLSVFNNESRGLFHHDAERSIDHQTILADVASNGLAKMFVKELHLDR